MSFSSTRWTSALAALVLAWSAAGCTGSSGSGAAGATDATSAVPAPTGGAATVAPSGPVATAGPTGTAGPTVTVVNPTITTTDPTAGTLTFDALAAGDPAAAKDGRLVLLLHGFPETGESFRDFLVPLADAGYYAVAPDQRGYSPGARPTDTSAYVITNLAADTLAMAASLGASQFHVVGHDWGGAVAWVTAVLGADRVTTVTSLSTPHPDAMGDAFADPNGEQAEQSGYMAVFRQPGYEDQLLKDGPPGFTRFFTAGGVPEAKAAAYAEVLGTSPALKAALDWYRANPLPTSARLGAVKVPALYVWGAQDPFLGRTSAENTKTYGGDRYRFEVIADGGHWLPERNAAQVLPLLLDHLHR